LGQGHQLRYFCQDESRLGLKTTTGRVITAPGVKPVVSVQWERENFWIYGAVEPLTGELFTQEYAQLNSHYFQQFLDAFSGYLGEDYALVQLDSSGAHLTNKLCWPENIIPLLQPAYSPELNPIERLWQAIKSHLKGNSISSLNNLRSRLAQVMEKMTKEQISSLTAYDFILEALFYAASH
jgi:DDE superfamily endonuclease